MFNDCTNYYDWYILILSQLKDSNTETSTNKSAAQLRARILKELTEIHSSFLDTATWLVWVSLINPMANMTDDHHRSPKHKWKLQVDLCSGMYAHNLSTYSLLDNCNNVDHNAPTGSEFYYHFSSIFGIINQFFSGTCYILLNLSEV